MAMTENQKGVVFMILASASFVVTDTWFQMISSQISVIEYLFMRGIVISFGILIIALRTGKPFPKDRQTQRKMFARALAELGLAISFLTAIANLPLSICTSILQTVPLVMTLVAYFVLKERFGVIRTLAVLCGFIGVLLIIKPGVGEFSPYYFLLALSVFFVALRDLISHSMPKDVPSPWVAYVSVTMVCVVSGLVVLVIGWKPVPVHLVVNIGLIGMVSIIAQILIVSAMRHGDISFVAPFRYSAILFAVLIDLFFFSRALDPLTVLGCFMVAGAGALVLYREGRRKAQSH